MPNFKSLPYREVGELVMSEWVSEGFRNYMYRLAFPIAASPAKNEEFMTTHDYRTHVVTMVGAVCMLLIQSNSSHPNGSVILPKELGISLEDFWLIKINYFSPKERTKSNWHWWNLFVCKFYTKLIWIKTISCIVFILEYL